jgi:hypothetical protein
VQDILLHHPILQKVMLQAMGMLEASYWISGGTELEVESRMSYW